MAGVVAFLFVTAVIGDHGFVGGLVALAGFGYIIAMLAMPILLIVILVLLPKRR